MALSNDERQRAKEIASSCSGMSNWDLGKAAARAAQNGDKSAAMGFMGAMKQNSDRRKSDWEQYKSGGSGCFITTAVCGSFGKPDDCYELTSFRKFRDNWLVKEADGKSLIAEYYEVAPKIVEKINKLANAKEVYHSIWDNHLKPCLTFIEQGSFAKCKETYVRMVRELSEKY